MKCPNCGVFDESGVLETRNADGGERIRRRRECGKCGRRFTTSEKIAHGWTAYGTRTKLVDVDEAASLYESGYSLRHVAKKLGISAPTLRRRLSGVTEIRGRGVKGWGE